MKDNKGLLAGVAVVVVIVIGVIIAMAGGGDKNYNNTSQAKDSMSMDQNSSNSEKMKSNNSANAVEADTVTISNYMYDPAAIKVKVGTTVTWTNNDSVQHNISPDSASADFTKGELFGKGKTYSFTFKKAGSYTYHCDPHPYMHGTVVVTE